MGSLTAKYVKFVRSNRQWLSSIESLASTLTWLLPDRFASSELAPEALSSVIGLFSVLNQHIVQTEGAAVGGGGGKDKSQGSRSGGGVPWGLMIGVLKEVEVLAEMAAESYCEEKEGVWNTVAAVEGLKSILRFIVFVKSGNRILLEGGQTANEGPALEDKVLGSRKEGEGEEEGGGGRFEAGRGGEARHLEASDWPQPNGRGWGGKGGAAMAALSKFRAKNGGQSEADGGRGREAWSAEDEPDAAEGRRRRRRRRTGGTPLPLPPPPTHLTKRERELRSAALQSLAGGGDSWQGQSAQAGSSSECEPRPMGGGPEADSDPNNQRTTPANDGAANWADRTKTAGEILHMFRPLVYVLLIRRYGRKSWRPWLVSAFLEFGSLGLVGHCGAIGGWVGGQGGGGGRRQEEEEEELKRRQVVLALYLMRTPFFDAYTKKALLGVSSVMKPAPLLGGLTEKAIDLVMGIQSYYFYTAAS